MLDQVKRAIKETPDFTGIRVSFQFGSGRKTVLSVVSDLLCIDGIWHLSDITTGVDYLIKESAIEACELVRRPIDFTRIFNRVNMIIANQNCLDAIKASGGPVALSAALGKISSQAISQWKITPSKWVIDVERISGISRRLLRPDLYREMDAVVVAP